MNSLGLSYDDIRPYRPTLNAAFMASVARKRRKQEKERERQQKIAAEIAAERAEQVLVLDEWRVRALAAERELRAAGIVPKRRIGAIIWRACRVFKLTRADIIGTDQTRHLVNARQFVMYWAVRRTNMSRPQIGRELGRRDHTTILHGESAYVAKRAKQGRTLRKAR